MELTLIGVLLMSLILDIKTAINANAAAVDAVVSALAVAKQNAADPVELLSIKQGIEEQTQKLNDALAAV